MRKRLIAHVAIFTALCFNLSAARINPEEALRKASEVLNKTTTRSSDISTLSINPYGNEIYVVNASEGGWVLIGNEDRLSQPVLAYSLTGQYSIEDLPDNARNQLEFYSKWITSIPRDSNVIHNQNTRTASEVAPLLGATEWGQTEPYNRLCPLLDGIRTVTGCVNTAISQIMYYHKYPVCGKGENSYTWNDVTLSMDFSKSVYEWDKMRPQYNGDYSDESALAVAKLMYDCGIANNSSYGYETGATLKIPGMVNFFGYDPSIYNVSRNLCTQNDYESILREELDAARPVFYSGGSSRGGHAFVCDGYDQQGYFHFNFGWNGAANGYYLTSATGFDSSPGFICSIMPNKNGVPGLWAGSKNDFLWDSDLNQITCLIDCSIYCGQKADIEVGLALEDTSTGTLEYYLIKKFDDSSGFCINSITFNEVVADGEYTVFPVYRVTGEKWRKVCFADNYSNHVNLKVMNGVKTFSNDDIGGEMADGVISINGCYYRLDGDAAIITKRNSRPGCYSGSVTIPADISIDDKYYRVVGMDNETFEKSSLDDVRIGEYVESIPFGAFSMSYIGDIIFSDQGNLKEIGPWAFNGTEIKAVNLPLGVNTIGMCGFQSCSMEEVDIPSSVEYISKSAFNYCMNLKNIYVHWTRTQSLPNLGETPFQGCDVESITLYVPKGCSDIYRNAPVWKDFVKIVEDTSDVAASDIKLNYTELTLTEGENETLTATVMPEDATDKTVTWTSSDESVATVSTEGVVTAVKAGTATITVASENGKTATCTVTVETKVIEVTEISISKTELTLTEGETATLTATVMPEDATDKTVTWTSSDESVATVSSEGVVTAVKAGTATITVASENGKTATCAVTVEAKVIEVSEIAISRTELTLTEGENETLTATVMPEDATDKTVTWTSSDESVATVSSEGVVTAVKAGTATITVASENGKTATCAVTVEAKVIEVSEIAISKTELTLTEGENETLTATVMPEDATDKTIYWTSLDETIATVSPEGEVTAVMAGTTRVVAATSNGKFATCTVTVEPAVILAESLIISPESWSGEEGSTFTITATVSPDNTTDKTLSWESSDESVAIVDAEGNVTVLKEGSCEITVATNDGTCLTARCVVSGLSGIDLIFADPEANVDVFNMQGILLKHRCTREELERLQPGMYILRQVNGKSTVYIHRNE